MIVGLLCGASVSASDEAELPLYFSGLREQGLFRVAEEYALARLADAENTPAQRAILASVPLPKLPQGYERDSANLEFWFRLQK